MLQASWLSSPVNFGLAFTESQEHEAEANTGNTYDSPKNPTRDQSTQVELGDPAELKTRKYKRTSSGAVGANKDGSRPKQVRYNECERAGLNATQPSPLERQHKSANRDNLIAMLTPIKSQLTGNPNNMMDVKYLVMVSIGLGVGVGEE